MSKTESDKVDAGKGLKKAPVHFSKSGKVDA